jgi:glycosyltransferase involved in cell wall biosynthesis
MACGTPALIGEETAAGAPDARHLLYTEALDASRWAQRIRELAGGLEQRRAEVARFARERWSWDDCAARYAALLRDLAA